MKKHFSFCAIILLANIYLFAQNVGIGDPLPSAKLTISGNETTPNGQAASLKIINTASTNAWYLRAGATGTNTPANGFSIGDNANIHFNLLSNGNLGLGIVPQSARLHVNGPIKIEGTNAFEFGAGIAGKELNAGKIGYNGFGTNALAIVGAGTNTTDRRVYFFAEGGTHFSGPVSISQDLNTGGQLQLNGIPGAAGQVITSNGASAPTWQDQAYSNNVRFAVGMRTGTSLQANCRIWFTNYNLSPTDISIEDDYILINRSGLYHFDIGLSGSVYFASAASVYPKFTIKFSGGGQPYTIANFRVMTASDDTNRSWNADGAGSIDVQVTAPAAIRVSYWISGVGIPPVSSFETSGYLIGHLIRE